jgi:hypothetical protein
MVQFRALRVCDGGKRAVRVLAENQQRRRRGAFDDGDDRLRCLDRVARLGAVDGVVLLAALAGRLRVVRNRRRRLGERTAGEVGAERAGFNGRDTDAERLEFLVQGTRKALQCRLGGGVLAGAGG